jgi:hypothetical protein
MSDKNPKLAGSNIIDCIPQTGECPNKCSECFYNGGRFFRTLDKPMIPTLKEAEGKIVRINSGHDSNLEKERVLTVTRCYKRKFYNTSIPNFDFPAPVVFTANRQCANNKIYLVQPTPNLMFVRARATLWNLDEVKKIIDYYWKKYKVPVVLTFMRFYNEDLIPAEYKSDYEWKQHIQNSYWCPKPETIIKIMSHFNGQGVLMCGTPYSSLCVDCRNCEFLFWECKRNMPNGKKRTQ